jgi:hypothetical protein
MTVDIAKATARLAARIGDQPPLVETEAELRDYIKHVWRRAALRYTEALNTIDEVSMQLDPAAFRDWSIGKQGRLGRQKARNMALREMHRRGAETKRRRGADTRKDVEKSWRALADTPKHERAGRIAERLNISAKTVRRHLQSITNDDR